MYDLGESLLLVLVILALIRVLIAVITVGSFTDIAEVKGCGMVKSRIWLLALIGGASLAGIYVGALPDMTK